MSFVEQKGGYTLTPEKVTGQKHSQILLLLLIPYIITYEGKFTICQENSQYAEKYEILCVIER